VVNVGLPSAQRALHFSDGERQWVVTAYALAFGSLLPLGGRIGDMFGRKPAFLTGLIGFAAVSAVRDLAQSHHGLRPPWSDEKPGDFLFSFGWLVAARDTALGRGASAVPLRPFIRTE
jgi:MFS family permease